MASSAIRIAGFGGQGVILAGMVIGKAATIYDGKYATLTQSFGPEARGSACSAQLVVADEPILYPYFIHPDILVVMSLEAYHRFRPTLKPGGVLIYEQDLVNLDEVAGDVTTFGIPATRFAEELGRRLVLNVVMVGFTTAVTGIVSPESARRAIRASVPAGTDALNLAAFEKGLEHGLAKLCAPHAA